MIEHFRLNIEYLRNANKFYFIIKNDGAKRLPQIINIQSSFLLSSFFESYLIYWIFMYCQGPGGHFLKIKSEGEFILRKYSSRQSAGAIYRRISIRCPIRECQPGREFHALCHEHASLPPLFHFEKHQSPEGTCWIWLYELIHGSRYRG